jgi:hypothetical protein
MFSSSVLATTHKMIAAVYIFLGALLISLTIGFAIWLIKECLKDKKEEK